MLCYQSTTTHDMCTSNDIQINYHWAVTGVIPLGRLVELPLLLLDEELLFALLLEEDLFAIEEEEEEVEEEVAAAAPS